MTGIELIAEVKNGHLNPKARTLLAGYLAKLEGKRVIIKLSKFVKRRSLQQNAYYWGVVLPMVWEMFQDAGNDMNKDEVHEFLKKHVWGWTKTVTLNGRTREITNSSARMSTMDWEVAMEKTRVFALQFNIKIPLPNEEIPDHEERNFEEETDAAQGTGAKIH